MGRIVESGEHGFDFGYRLEEVCNCTLTYLDDGGVVLHDLETGEDIDLEEMVRFLSDYVYSIEYEYGYTGRISGYVNTKAGYRWIELLPDYCGETLIKLWKHA